MQAGGGRCGRGRARAGRGTAGRQGRRAGGRAGVRAWVCVCVNHLKRCKTSISDFRLYFPVLFVSFQSKQGHMASLTYRVQRSYGLGWDIRADHPDVPASVLFLVMGCG